MEALLDRFAWVDGHADIWRVFSDAAAFRAVTSALADPFRTEGVTKVAGIEARGFILGAAVARELDAGFVAIRKEAGLLPGDKLVRHSEPDYRGNRHVLRLQREAVGAGDRVIIADDWCETGNQALAARELIEAAGATFAGISVIVDQLDPDIRPQLEPYAALVRSDELGPSA